MAMQAVSGLGLRGKHDEQAVAEQLHHPAVVLLEGLGTGRVVSWVTKRPAVSSPSRSKMPVLPTRSANTTVATMFSVRVSGVK